MITLSDDPVVRSTGRPTAPGWPARWRPTAASGPRCGWSGPTAATPVGSPARPTQHAELGPWTRSGHRVAVIIPDYAELTSRPRCYLADPATGDLHPLATGDLLSVLDLSVDEHLVILQGRPAGQAVLRGGRPGRRRTIIRCCPIPATGSTEVAIIRPAPPGDASPLIAYVCHRRRPAPPPAGRRAARRRRAGAGASGVLAARDDAELEGLDADDAGRLLLLVWNVAGRSELELFDTATGDRAGRMPGLPGEVVSGVAAQPGRPPGDHERRGPAPAAGAVVPEHPDPAVGPGHRRAAGCPSASWSRRS